MKEKKQEEYTEVISQKESEPENPNVGKQVQDYYQYMQTDQYRKKLDITRSDQRRGNELVKDGMIKIDSVRKAYLVETEESVYEIYATGIEEVRKQKRSFPMRMLVDRSNVLESRCSCTECQRNYSYWRVKECCAYTSGLLTLVEDYFRKNRVADATDLTAEHLLYTFQMKRKSMIISDNRNENESLELEPKIIKKDETLGLGFRVGAGKLFVVKDLIQFAHNVKESKTEVYGTSTSINHGIQNFKPQAQKWIHFIFDAVQEEEQIRERVRRKVGNVKEGKLSQISLYGWRMDRLYEIMGNGKMMYENRYSKQKGTLMTALGHPELTMEIKPEMEKKQFQGIHVSMKFPKLYPGAQTAYYIDENVGRLKKIEPEFYEKIRPLVEQETFGLVDFTVGRNHLSEFYYHVLPQLEEDINVVEEQPELIEQYLTPEAQFSFYLDAPQDDVTCRVRVKYGEMEYSVLDQRRKQTIASDGKRFDVKEQEILFYLSELFPSIDLDYDMLSCAGDENRMYEVIAEGVEKLSDLGDVYCTNRFKHINAMKKPNVSVGVRVSSGLLDLDIQTGDLSQEELLDLLKHYNSRQKYYRFKSGEFADLTDDSLQMLFEMMESMHLSPKEFVKGKMHLPLYRALYLDKMLEEHEEVYHTRDKVFRELIKNMKSVNDSDYEVPQSLQKTMRKYQKNGFLWLRTLESCNFGGILADDMGLGKTLQMISVLLSAKEEGKKGTSLIVAPASLVYNWGEEFEKFAPALHVALVTGKPQEREKQIADYESADVLVTSYDLLKRDIDLYEGKSFLYEVIDEAQYIKNQTTAASKAVKLIQSQTRFALTGTPIENRLSELWSIFDYLMPGFLYKYEEFKKEFESPIVKNEDADALQRLQKMVSPFILRRLKSDVLKDLPKKLEETRVVRFEGEQQKLYDAQLAHMKQAIATTDESDFNKKKFEILAELTKLRQVCCDPHLCFENYKGESAKLESCLDLIKSAMEGGHKILLFSQFTSMLEIIEKRLEQENIAYYKITGETSKQNRVAMVRTFNEDETPVFLISLKAGGVGLNLTGADVVIHYDPWWNVAVQNQATDRAHRIGQTKKVTVYKMIAKGTIEEKIQKLQETKKDLADSVINGDTVGMGSMSKEELLDLLGIDG
ncbi:MAG: DEAD/DEAH box helicase [Lachnospiraceae bacterium]